MFFFCDFVDVEERRVSTLPPPIPVVLAAASSATHTHTHTARFVQRSLLM